MASELGKSRVTCITCGKDFSGINQWRSKNHACIAALKSQEDLRGFEEDQSLDIETRDAAKETKSKIEHWAYEKLAPRLEVNHATKAEVVAAYNYLSPVHKLAVNKRFQYTESEVYMAEDELTWNKHTGREAEVEEMRHILEEEKRVLAEAIKSVTRHVLLQRGVNPRLIDVMVEIPDKQARKIAIRELLKSLK